MEEKKTDYIPNAFTVTGVSDDLCEYLVKLGIARKIYPSVSISNDELDKQVDIDEPNKS